MPRAMTAASWTSMVGVFMSFAASASIAGLVRWKQSSVDLKRESSEGSSDAGTADEEAGKAWDPLPPLLTWIEDARAGGAKTLALELLITSGGVSGELDEEHPFASAVDLAGVDFSGMRREAFSAAGLTLDESD
jgi:hypothetical protein